MTVRRFAVSSLVLLAVCSAALAQPVRLPGITGANVTGFVTMHDTLYATTGDYGGGDVFRSTDYGASWHSLAANLPMSAPVQTFAIRNNWLVAGTHFGLFYSSDQGQHWRKADSSLIYGSIDAMMINDSEIVVNNWPYGIFTAETLTGKWTRQLDVRRAAHGMVRHHGSIYLATQGDGVYSAPAGEGPWKNLIAGLSGNAAYVMALAEFKGDLYAGTIDGAYRFDDAAEMWVRIDGLPAQSVMAFAATNEALYANDGVSGIFASADAKVWQKITDGLPEFTQTRGMAAVGSYIFTASSREGAYRADASHPIWARSSLGISNLSIARVLSFTSTKGQPMLIAGGDDADFGLAWISTDHGDSWSSCDSLTNRGFRDFASKDGKLFAATDGLGLFASNDDGATWKNADIQTTYPTTICATRRALITGTSGFSFGVLRSIDNGESWQSATTNIPGANVDHIVYDSVSGKTFAGTGGVGFYASNDDGDNWELQPAGPSALTGMVRFGTTLVASDNTGVFLSTDDGGTWQFQASAPTKVYAIARIANTLVISSANRIYTSIDGAANWQLFDSLPMPAVIRSIALDQNFVYYGTNDYGLWRAPLPSAAVAANRDLPKLAADVRNGVLRVTLPMDAVIHVRDILGRTLATTRAPAGTTTLTVDTPHGAFIMVSVETGGDRQVLKMIVP